MITAESTQSRRIVGSLDRGADLMTALKNACRDYRVGAAEVRAIGTLEQVELCSFDHRTRRWNPPRTLTGGMELLSLNGNVSDQAGSTALSLQATIMRDRDTGIELVGGHVLSARAYHVEFVIDAFDDLRLRRAHDAQRGLAVLTDARQGSAPVELPDHPDPTIDHIDQVVGQAVGPLAGAAPAPYNPDETEEVQEIDDIGDIDELPVDTLAEGDVIVHPKFKRCVVQRIEGDHEFVQVRLRNGRLVRLSLAVMSLTLRGSEDGRRVYEAEIG